MNNVISRHRAPLNKDVRQYRRYSNYYVDSYGIIRNDDGSIYMGESTSSSSTSGSGTSSSSTSGSGTSSSVNWGGLLGQLINGTTSVLTSMFGRTEAAQLNAYQTMYKQEQRTNTILWVVIGLVVAMGVVLVLRKTK